MKLAVAIPTYNEAANIKKLLPAIKKNLTDYPAVDCTVFVIDDNSPDGTADISESLGKELSSKTFSVKVLKRKKKEGLGKAYVYAFHKILDQNFDYVLQMDADLSHDPKYLPEFLDATKHADFVVGSRYVKGGATPDWSWNRKLLSRGGNLYTRLMLGSKITDYTGGYNLFSAKLLHDLDLKKLQSSGYGFLIELKYRAVKKGHNTVQVPIVFMDRQHGDSKLPGGIIFKNLMLVAHIKYNSLKK
jgi:dolichol-phosphate mannosyltransferase